MIKKLLLWGEIERGATVPLDVQKVRVDEKAIGVMIFTDNDGKTTARVVYPDFSSIEF